jgi:Outer membrane protein beta-barrel domain
MRRSWKCIVLFTVSLAGLSPELEAAGRFGFGVQGGLALTNHWSTQEKGGNYTVESSIKAGFAAGALAVFRISRIFSLEADVLYVKKGSNQTISIPGFPLGDIEVTYELDYIEVPLLLRTHLFPSAKIQPTLAGGLCLAFLTAKEYNYRIAAIGNVEAEIEGIESTDYGFTTGVGLDIPADVCSLRFEYRYSMGFVDLKLPTGPGFPEIELRNYGHYLMFGLAF